MQKSKLICPHCQSPYPAWRAIVRFRPPICPTCKSKLAFSLLSAQRLGAILGLIFSVILFPTVFVIGPDKVWTWEFWAFFVPFSYFLGAVVMVVVGRLVPYDEVRATKMSMQALFPNVTGRHRTFLLVQLIVIPPCAIVLAFARSLPIWLVVALSTIVGVVGIFGSIGTWHWLFGEKGILRGKNSDDAA